MGMKYWIKTMCDDRKLIDRLINVKIPLTYPNFAAILWEICEQCDLDTPMALPSHYKHLTRFNCVKFLPDDFVARVDFDYLLIEAVG